MHVVQLIYTFLSNNNPIIRPSIRCR